MSSSTTGNSVAPAPPRFDTTTVLTLGVAHCIHDLYPAFIGVLLPVLIARFDLSLAAAGLLASILTFTSVSQPLLGYVVDRTDARLWVIVTPAVTAILISLLAIAPSPAIAFLLLLLAGISLSAFHPAAGSLVTRVAAGQWGKATSVFMTGGAAGAAIGPLFIAATIAAVGVGASWLAFIPGLIYSAILYVTLRRAAGRIVRQKPGPIGAAVRRQRRAIVLLGCAVIFQAMGVVGFTTFYPTFVTQSGQTLVDAGIAMAVFQGGGAAGSLGSGWLSDRLGRRTILLVSPLAGVPFLLAAVVTGGVAIHLPILFAAGALVLSAGPVQLAYVQELMPENRSTAAGMMFLLAIGAASMASVAVGILGDAIGLERALIVGVLGGALALPFVLLLPASGRIRRVPAATPDAAKPGGG